MEKGKKNTADTTYNSDVTQEDLKVLGQDFKNIHTDGGDDSQLKNRKNKIDFTGNDLDVPGRNTKSTTGTKKLKDEENSLYSQGSAPNENLEEQSDQYIK